MRRACLSFQSRIFIIRSTFGERLSHSPSLSLVARPVFYVARFVPGYRIPVLERLDARLGGRLVVCSGLPPDTSSLNYLVGEQAPGYRQIRLRNYWLRGDRVHAQPFGRAFREAGDPAVVLAEESPRSVTLPALLRYARRRGAGRALWGHFSSLYRRFEPEKNLLDRYRLSLARRVEACACYTEGVAAHLRPYLPDEKLFVARNTIDLGPLLAQHDALAAEGKAAVRRRLGLPLAAPVLLFMGRLVPQKGTELLLDTFARLRRDGPATLILIGTGPEQPQMEARIAREGLGDVRFVGPLPDEEAAPYLFAADLMLMPGYLGLVINHAFAFGLPVVSQARPAGVAFHSPEVEYVSPGQTGLLTETEGADALADAVRAVLADGEGYATRALAYAREHLQLTQMVDGLADAIAYAEQQAQEEAGEPEQG